MVKLSKLHVVSMLALGFWGAQSLATSLTPNSIGGGDIPGSYPDVQFSLSDGNWARTIKLPLKAANQATIAITNKATYATSVMLDNTNVPLPTLSMVRGDSSNFVFDAGSGRWLISLKDGSPKQSGAKMPDQTSKLAGYALSSDDWAPVITLPSTAPKGAVLLVRSTAATGSKISAEGVLYPSTMNLNAGDEYAFTYSGSEKKWQLTKSPVQVVSVGRLVNGALPAMTAPRLSLDIPPKTGAMTLRLPAGAGDRDRIRLSSASEVASSISSDGVDYRGSMYLRSGDVYEFMWVAELGKWTLMSSPVLTVKVKDFAGGFVPPMTSPRTIVVAEDGNWASFIRLPLIAKTGDRVTVKSVAKFGFSVGALKGALQIKPEEITYDDQKSFVFKSDGTWGVETINVTLLSVYSDGVVDKLGEQAARARQLESVRLTNEALENSGANFRVKVVGLMRHRNQGATLGDAIANLRTDPVVQGERTTRKANAVYYEGTESGCGLAWMNARATAFNMVASGSTACGTGVMRHEFGHNMGLTHGDSGGGSAPYAKGYPRVGTIMGGNAMPYYSTPKRFDSTTGIPLGIADEVDAVRAMNDRSAAVSKFSQ